MIKKREEYFTITKVEKDCNYQDIPKEKKYKLKCDNYNCEHHKEPMMIGANQHIYKLSGTPYKFCSYNCRVKFLKNNPELKDPYKRFAKKGLDKRK